MAALKGAFINLSAGLLGKPAEHRRLSVQPRPGHAESPAGPAANAEHRRGPTDASQQPGQPSESIQLQPAGGRHRPARRQQSHRGGQRHPAHAVSVGVVDGAEELALDRPLQPERRQESRTSTRRRSYLPSCSSGGRCASYRSALPALASPRRNTTRLLNPVRAEVSVNVQVLTPSQLQGRHIGASAPTSIRKGSRRSWRRSTW